MHNKIIKCLSLVICGVISLSLRWRKDHLNSLGEGGPLPPQMKLYCHTYLQTKVDLFLYLIFNDNMSFPVKVYEINMYLYLYLSFKIKVLEYTPLHYNPMLFM